MAEPPPSPFDDLIGTELIEVGPEQTRARITVTDRHKQPFGLVHGGVFTTLAESLCSGATYRTVGDEGMIAMAQSNSATFLRPITTATSTPSHAVRHRGRTTWVWEVEISDDDGRLCALVQATIAVRPAPG